MAKGWMSLALIASWLGACASVVAQPGPGPAPQIAQNMPLVQGPAGGQGFNPTGPELLPPSFPSPGTEETGVQGPSFYIGFEYLLWATRKQSLPPLLTSGAFSDPIPGALGQPNTQVLIGGNDGQTSLHSGERLSLGLQLDESWGVEANTFLLQSTGRSSMSSAGAPGSAVLARPFFNANVGVEDADPVAVPNVMSGTFTVSMPQNLYGVDANLRYTYLNDRSQNYRIAILAGARFIELDEKLLIGESLQDIPGLGTPGNSYLLSENFTTHNSFYGGQLGFAYDWRLGPVTFGLTSTVAVGNTHQVLTNSASTQITEPDGTVTASANRALLIQPSNAGQYSREVFSVVPETKVNLALDINEHIRIGVGYNFIYWTGVARPADQIDRTINIQALQPFDQIGPARPAPIFTSSNFWAQGLTAQLGFTF